MRNRLTQRVAADTVADKGTGIMNDPYQVNNPEHEKNDPAIGEYAKGDPEAWNEGVNKENLWKKDKRDPSTHIPEITAKMAAEAIQAGRKLEEKAIKCIVASQRILPGAVDATIESQAAELMNLPDNMVDSLLSRQEELAGSIAKAANATCEMTEEEKKKEGEKDAAKKEDEEDDDAEVEAAKKEDDEEDDEEDAEVEAAEKKLQELQEQMTKLAADMSGLEKWREEQKAKKGKKPEEELDASKKPEEMMKEEKDAAAPALEGDKPEEKKPEEKKPDAKKPDAKKPEGEMEITFGEGEGEEGAKDASENLLDDIFSSVIASDSKKGAKSLSGLVKKEASESRDPLKGMWDDRTPPDVSSHFQ